MEAELFSTPSRRTSEHHGMADRKPKKFKIIPNIDDCCRRLFHDDDQHYQEKKLTPKVISLRF